MSEIIRQYVLEQSAGTPYEDEEPVDSNELELLQQYYVGKQKPRATR